MSPQQLRALKQLSRLASSLEPSVRIAFDQALRQLQLGADVQAAAEALARGDVEGAVRALLPEQATTAFAHRLTVAVSKIVQVAGPATAKEIASIVRVDFHFVPGSKAAADVMAQMDLAAIVPVERGAESGLRATLREGLLAGENPRVVAREARAFVGLTEYDHSLITSFVDQVVNDPAMALTRDLRDRRFDAILQKAIDGTPATESQLAAMREGYIRKLHNWRAETWARTTSLDALRATQQATWKQLTDDFGIPERRILRRWVTAHDDRVRPEHAAMDGATAPLDGVYSNGQAYPGQGDFNCRCVETYRLVAA